MRESTAVTTARAELEAALTADQRQRRTILIDRLSIVRHELQEKKRALDTCTQLIVQGQEALNAVRSNLLRVGEAIADSAQRRPVHYDYLPNDADCAAWRAQHTALEKQRQELLNQRAALPNIELERLNAVHLTQHVQGRDFELQAILNELQSSFGIQPGGVTAPQ